MKIVHDAENGTIKVVGTEIGSIGKVLQSPYEAFKTVFLKESSSWTDEDLEAMGDFFDDPYHGVSDFVVDAHEALEKRLGFDVASKKVANGDVWKTTAGELSFDRLTKFSKNPESTPNSYGLIEQQANLVPKEPVIDRKIIRNVLMNVSIQMGSGCLFTTNTGYLGLARHTVLPDDALCLLFGCKLPAVFRPQEDRLYNLITFTCTDDVVVDQAVTEEFVNNIGPQEEKEFLLR